MKNLASKLSRKTQLISASASVFALVLASGMYFYFSASTSDASESASSGPPPATVVIDQARSMRMEPHTVLPGTVVSVRDAVIASEASGKVLSVANIGDVIEKGDRLAQIDPRDAEQLVAQRKADLQRLQSLLEYHENYYARVGVEDDRLGFSAIRVAEIKSNRDTAEANVASAQAALQSANNDLQRTSILAPFAGRVVSQSIQTGEYAQVGSPIARLVDIINLEVSARVPASLVQPIEAGTLIRITGMGKTLSVPVRALVPVGDSVSRTMELRVELNDSGLLVGSPVRVSLPSAQAKDVVAIPRDAVILRTDTQYVFVVEEGKAHRRDVELGYAEGDMIEVIGDVNADATVVVRGGERLRDGQGVSWEELDTDLGAGALSSL